MMNSMKDRECISCIHFLMCSGKPTPAPCVKYEERKNNEYGGKKNVHNEDC